MAPPEGCSYIFDHYVTNSKGDCPIAMCSPAPNGCTYIDKYIMSKYGECCPSLCYAVDSDGNECNFDDNDPNPSIEGELCTADDEQKNTFGCPVASCMTPPEGWSYIFDHYVINSQGDCCASMCYAVDLDGEARYFEITSSGQAIILWPSLANAIICSIIIIKSMV
eukprot:360936_1